MYIAKQGEALPAYMESREKLLAREKTQQTGGQIVLNSKEQKVMIKSDRYICSYTAILFCLWCIQTSSLCIG